MGERKQNTVKHILIAYSSKTGTAEACAHMLETELKGLRVTVADLDREQPDPSDFDVAVVGGSVRYAKLRSGAASYLRQYERILCEMPHGLFLCCGFGHTFEEYSEKMFSGALRNSAFAVINFGGRLKLEHAGVWEKILLYFVRSSIRESEIENGEYSPELPSILPENIGRMASVLRRELQS